MVLKLHTVTLSDELDDGLEIGDGRVSGQVLMGCVAVILRNDQRFLGEICDSGIKRVLGRTT